MVFYFGDGEQTVGTPPEPFDSSARFTDAGAVFGYGTDAGGRMRVTSGGVDEGGAEYIRYQGADARSVIDEDNLRTLAEQLGVEYRHRSADTAPELPAAPSTTTGYRESGEVGDVIELYGIAASALVALLGVELVRAAMLAARLRGVGAPRPTGRRGGTT